MFGDNATELSTSACYEPETYQRLVDIKHHYDPANLIRLGRAIPVNAR
ncbi:MULTISPECIES: BBE domain-containing protein [Auritidibacter]